ncbi:MAG: glycosyltransferase family 39 protein [Patescibacteria group bacterium]|nr:glycosyltransferase family 39 protein [Patescibacteria group bacterium]
MSKFILMNYLKKHSNTIMLLLILVVAFFSRLYFFSQEGFITTDGVKYALAGKNLIENGKYEVFGNPELIFSPGYPIFIGIANCFFDNLLFSARFISFIFGFLAVYFFYLVGKEIFNKTAGLFAAFFAATHYMFIVLSVETWSESLYSFFVLLIVFIYLKLFNQYKTWLAVTLGFVIGYTYLIKPEGMIFLAFPLLFFIFKKKELGIKKAMQGFLIVVFSFIFVIAPYIFFLHHHTGKISLTTKSAPNLVAGVIFDGKDFGKISRDESVLYEQTFLNYDEETNSVKLSKEFENISLKKHIFDDPTCFLDRYIKGIWSELIILVNLYSIDIFLIPISALFLFSLATRKLFKKIFILSFFPIGFLLTFPIFHIESRYILQAMIFIILLASIGCSLRPKSILLTVKSIKFNTGNFFLVLGLLIAMLVFINFAGIMSYYLYYSFDYPMEHKIVGEYLKNNPSYNSDKDIIMSRKPFVSFYADSKNGGPIIPYTTVENVIKFAKSQNVSYIIIGKRYLGIRDNYEELANLGEYSEDIELFYEDDSIKPIKIFRLSFDE